MTSLEAENQKTRIPWKCGESFLHPLPEHDGDPWKSLLKPMLEDDTIKCDAWTDEVQNLLLFAGLFSAVVTAFAVETFKDLQEDPVVALLSQIAASSPNNGSAGIPPFTPSASTIRLNVFLFLSLILSLSSVLIGIVALQWIREHRQYSNTLTPQNAFATLHMRTEALRRWYVPQIFACLPLLLQSALVFFFAGIIQLLVDASAIVLIPVACVMGITILFLVLTTILPTAQAATLSHSGLNINDDIPVPCPYKSPQAKAFRRLITSSGLLFRSSSFAFAAIYRVALWLLLLPRKIASMAFVVTAIQQVRDFGLSALNHVSKLFTALATPLTRTLFSADRHAFEYMRPKIFYYWRLHSWLDFDLAWMSIRDNYFQSVCSPGSWLFENRELSHDIAALYDAVQGLCDELTRDDFNINANPEPAIITAYHCAMSLCFPSLGHLDSNDDTPVKALFIRNQYLATLLGSGELTPLRPFSRQVTPSAFHILWDETSFVFLNFIQEQLNNAGRTSPVLTNHFAEVYIRMLNELYSKPHEMDRDPQSEHAPNLAFEAEDLYVMKIYDAPNQPFTYQWATSIHSFFRVLSDDSIPYPKLVRSFHAHPFFRGYSANFWRQLKYEIHTNSAHEDTVNAVLDTLSFVGRILDEFPKIYGSRESENTFQPRLQFILHSVASHLWMFGRQNIDHDALITAVKKTIETLQNVKGDLDRVGVEVISPEKLEVSSGFQDEGEDLSTWFSRAWWSELFADFYASHDNNDSVARQDVSDARGVPLGVEIWQERPLRSPLDSRNPLLWPEPQ